MSSRILNVSYKSQNDPDAQSENNDCGPCCLAMLLLTQGQSVATADVYAASGVGTDRALTFDEVKTAAGGFGLPLSWRTGISLQDVRSYIDQGTPVIALIKYQYLPDRQGQSTTGGHFVVVVGYDDDAGEIVINDPYYWGPLRDKGDHHHYDYNTWEQAWGRCNEDGNPNHSILIAQLAQPVPATADYVPPAPLPGVTTVYVLTSADQYNGLKLRPVRDPQVSGPAVFSGRPLTVVLGPVADGSADWFLVRTQSADDVAGWACARRDDEVYIGSAPNAASAPALGPVTPPARTAYVQPDVEKYGGLKLRPMRDVRLDGPVAHAGMALSVVADPVGSGDNEWRLVTLQDGKDTAGWVRVRQGAETYVSDSVSQDITSAPVAKPTEPIAAGDVWVIAPAGLILRAQPSSPITKLMDTLPFGAHLTALGPAAGLDEKGRTWLQVRTDAGLVGWVPASASGDHLVADTKPAEPYLVQVLDTLPVRQAGGLRVRDTRDVDSPELDMTQIGERLVVYTGVQEADGTPWLWVKSPRNKYGWARQKSGDVMLVGKVDEPAPVTRPTVTPVAWPYGKCLAGVGIANPQPLLPSERDVIASSRVEAVKVLTLDDPDQNRQLVHDLKSVRPDLFIAARLFIQLDLDNKTRFSPQNFFDYVQAKVRALYESDVRYFEVHNEPNLEQEGLGWNWADGAGFGTWLIQVLGLLRASFPEAKFGFPGLSPQPNVPAFLDGAASAIAQCDWVGIHCYWQDDGAGHWQMQNDDGGMYWRGFRQRYPDKLLMITEFSNNNREMPHVNKGQQYARYYQLLRNEPNLGAAFAFALSWPGQDNNREGWISDNETTPISGTLSALLAQPGFLA